MEGRRLENINLIKFKKQGHSRSISIFTYTFSNKIKQVELYRLNQFIVLELYLLYNIFTSHIKALKIYIKIKHSIQFQHISSIITYTSFILRDMHSLMQSHVNHIFQNINVTTDFISDIPVF